MDTKRICPGCQKPLSPDVPMGLCPECLIKSGFNTGTEPGAAGKGFVPPPLDQIARLFPQLEIIELIGKGGMGAVYKARQPTLDRFVALKILPPHVAGAPGFAERFNREARALARLVHPNIVAVHDFGQAGELNYFIMEFVDGANLREVERAGRLAPEQALAIVPQICEALQFAHNEGIVHRDIKPENILLDKKGRVKITDFGIAKILGQTADKAPLTGAQDVVGTPHYMAPEQIERPGLVDHRADIFSLGVVFYEMLTGELPLGKFQPPSHRAQTDVRLDEVVMHALEKEPARRYQQASQVKTEVETIAGTPPTPGKTAPAETPPPTLSVPAGPVTSDKAILPAFLLAFCFGIFGAHRFYVGKIWTAVLQLAGLAGCIFLIIACATFGSAAQPVTGIMLGVLICGCGIWATVDWILLACKGFTDGRGKRMTNWLHPQPGETKPPARPQPAPAAAGPHPATIAPLTASASTNGLVEAPAIALMIAAGLKLFSALTSLLFLAGLKASPLNGLFRHLGLGSFGFWNIPMGISLILISVVPGVLILYGGFQMFQRRSYGWALAAGIIAIVSCGVISVPVGIWALIILARDDVQSIFANHPSPGPGMPASDLFWRRAVMIAGGVILILIALVVVAKILSQIFSTLDRQRGHVEPLTIQNLDQAIIQPGSAFGEFHKDWSNSFPLTADGSFHLDNVNGRIAIHGWNSNVVDIRAVIHGQTAASVAAIRIETGADPDAVTVHTREPSDTGGFSSGWDWLFNGIKTEKANVDYTVLVPSGAHLADVTSVNGRLDIAGVAGDIEASTVNGETKIEDAAHNLKLSTVNGQIRADMIRLGSGQSVSFDTVNGAIELALPADAAADFSVNTLNGDITSEFPALKPKKIFPVGHKLNGSLGSDGGSVKMTTVNGGVSIVKSRALRPVPADTAAATVAGLPPVVVGTWPVSGTGDMAPGIVELRARFSKPMTAGSWSWSQAWAGSAPEFIGQPRYEADGLTCVAVVKLEPGRTYAWWLNSEKFQNFTDLAGRAVPYLLIFQTRPN